MIDQERQATFRGQFKQFAISLRMSSEDTLSITVENTQTLDRYHRTVDREYISQQDAFFQGVFQRAEDVYDCLKASFSQIVVEGEFLLFDIEYGKNKKFKRISIQLLREVIDPADFAHLKTEKMKEHFTALLLQKDIEIQELKQKYEDMVERHSAEIQQLRGEIHQIRGQLRGELEAEKAKSRQIAENQAHLLPLVPLLPLVSVVQDLKKLLKLYSWQVNLFQNIGHHPDNSHKDCYALTNLTGMSTRITRIKENDNWYNFVNKCEVLPHQKAKYSLMINKTRYISIMFGFCTEKGLGNICNFQHAESAYYQCYGAGYLWQSGSRKQIGVHTVAGETMECVADLSSFKLSWWKKGSRIAECVVPFGMRNKPIFISILLFHTGDEVDLCV